MSSDSIRKWMLGLIIILALKVIFLPPFQLQLRSEEPRRAIISMEMIFSGNYLEPQIHGWSYYNKPPIFNWVVAFFMEFFDSFDEWVVRLPGLLAHVITALCIYLFSRKHITKEGAIIAALFYLTAGEILFYGSVIAGQIDLFYSLLVFLQLAFLFRGMTNGIKYHHLFLSYLFLGLGVLTKGVPSIAFQVLTIFGWYIVGPRSNRRLSILAHIIGMLLSGAVVGFYFYFYERQGGLSSIYLINLFNEASQKSALETQGFELLKNIFAFPGAFLKLLLPWVLLLPLLLIRVLRQELWKNIFSRFAIIMIIANISIYWASGYITTRYLFPFVPFLAIITAHTATLAITNGYNRPIRYFFKFIQLLVIIAPIGILGYILSQNGIYIRHPWWKFIFAILVSVATLFAMTKLVNHRWLLSIFFVLILKQYSQWTYYPTRYADERVNSLIAQVPILFAYTQGRSIHLLGYPERHDIDVSLGHWTFVETQFEDAMPLSYQLPYYIEKSQNEIMQFHTKPEQDRFYLVRKEELTQLVKTDEIEVLYEFIDDWKRIPLALIKT